MLRLFVAITFAGLAALAPAARAWGVPIDIGTLSGVRDLGPAPASLIVRVAVVLKYRHQDELDDLVERQADPASHLYHQFLTPAQFTSYFGVQAAEYARLASELRRAGFTIERTFSNRTVLDASAPAPVVARYFTTDIHRVVSPELGMTHTNVLAGRVPGVIADLTRGVFGLDGAAIFRTPLLRAQRPRASFPAKRDGFPLFGPDGGYGPPIFDMAYDFPVASGITGEGRASGFDMDGQFLESDLNAYLAYFGVTRSGPPSTIVSVQGGAPQFPKGHALESTLDSQSIVALAPGTALYAYEIPVLAEGTVVDAFNQVVTDNFVDSMNSSWVFCEARDQRSVPEAFDAIEEQGASLGITFHSAAGDNGTLPVCTKSPTVGVPADTPHNIGVGGTRLEVDRSTGQETSEVAWNDLGYDGTGGGVSRVFNVPSYQKGVLNVIRGGRNVPDVAFEGDPDTGASNYFNGAFDGPVAGTSLASPVFGAALAAINQVQNSRSGYFNVTLYKTWSKHGYGSPPTLYIRDIVQGSDPPYYALPGYDQMTGIGALQAGNFAQLLESHH
jgi:kumamolisin